MNDLTAFLGAMAHAPQLPGARCVGRHELFDEAEPGEDAEQRHQQAAGLCQHCPSLEPCRQWVDSLPAHKKPPGVTAGQIRNPPKKRRRAA